MEEQSSQKHLRRLTLAAAAILLSALAVVCIRRYSHQPVKEHFASASPATRDPRMLLAEANHLYWISNSAKAGPLYAEAEELFRESGDRRDELYAHVGRIRCYAETQSFVDISNYLAKQLNTPLVENDRRLKLWVLAAKGMTDIEINPAVAKKDWQEARKVARALGEKQWAARADGELGLVAFLEGDSRTAGLLVGGALLSAMASGDVGGQIRYLELLGNGFNELQRPEEALLFFDRAIRLASITQDTGFPFMAYEGKADALIALKRGEEAKSVLGQALKTAKLEQKRGHETQCLISLGRLSLQANELDQTIDYLERAQAIAQKIDFYRMIADAAFDLAKIYEKQGDLQKAEARLSVGLDASQRVGDRYYLPRNLTALAELKAQEGETATADALYERAEDVIDGLVMEMPGAYSKSALVAGMSETYLRHFQLAAGTNNVTRAFEIVERARGRTIADQLRAPSERRDAAPPGSAAIASEISTLQLRLMRSEDPRERQDLLESLEEAEQRLAYLGESVPDSSHVMFARPVTLATVQKVLEPDELLLEYVLNEPQSYCLVVSKTQARLVSLTAGRRQIDQLIGRYLGEIASKQDAGASAAQLYALLLTPVLNRSVCEHLIIVPDGILNLLPFDSLRDHAGHYVVASSSVTISPSATVLEVLRTKPRRPEPHHTLLALGGVPYEQGPPALAEMTQSGSLTGKLLRGLYDFAGVRLQNLPETQEEVMAVARELGLKGSTVLTGEAATEHRFESEPLADFKVLHLAVHAIASTRYPERAGLVLGRDSSTTGDGLLQERAIAGLSLNADLVTLSACDTAVGKQEGEEGVTSLANAFLVAGSRTVVATLWSVQDNFTTEFMERFYKHLAQGEDKASALREAKTDFLATHPSAPPVDWAAFILVGDGSSPIPLETR